MSKDTRIKYIIIAAIVIFSALVVLMLKQDIQLAIVVSLVLTVIALFAGRIAEADNSST